MKVGGSSPLPPTTMPLKILYEDVSLLIVDKPPGMPVFREGPGEGMYVAEALSSQYPELLKLGEECRYGIVHRLDKDTSGVLLVAKTKEAFRYFQEQFKERKAEKTYICLVVGALKEKEGVIEGKLGRSPNDRRKQKVFADPAIESAREATTLYKVLKEFSEFTLLEVSPKTGRKHQIRAHLAHIHHPIAGDKLYGFKNQPVPQGLERQFLHANSLKIVTENGKGMTFHSELPEDLQNILNALRIN
ncbi:MAG: RluA family pseudouridine synthase [bacterium]|nr:RluA family pseudouridine synthase [bacterium]